MGNNRIDLGRDLSMKIALVSPYDFSYPGGVTEHTAALANELQQRGHEIHIFAACSGYQGNLFPNIRAVTHTIATIPIAGTMARVGLSPLGYLRVKKILEQEAFDVIHLQEPLAPSITWWFLMLAHHLPRTAFIGTFHAYHEQPNWFYQQGRPFFGRLFKRLDALIAVSEAAHHFAYQMFPGNYQMIANGIDLKRFGKATEDNINLSDPAKKLTILFVGRLDKRKGFSHLFEAFVKLKPDYPQLKLQVIGPFEAKTHYPYRKIAWSQGVTDIEFVGYVSQARLPTFYHQADIFCAPSTGFESFGIVLLEAMAAELPIVTSNIAGYRSVVTDGQEGLLTPPGQPDQLAEALRQLIDQPELRRRMGQLGRLKANQFSWNLIVDKTLELYDNTIQNKLFQFKSTHQVKPESSSVEIHIQRRQANHVERSRSQI
jgi:phosphatidylinositol alpha-mannosyltransferase